MLAAFLDYLMASGVPEYTIVLLLYLPVVATIVTFTRYILGWKSLTIYASLLMTFAIYDLAQVQGEVDIVRGFAQGGSFILAASFIAYVFQNFTREIRIHYLAKVSLILTFVTATMFFLLYGLLQFNNRTFIDLSPLSVVVIILVTDIFIRGFLRKGPEKSAQLILQTVGLSYVLFFIIAQPQIKDFFLNHPEAVLYTILVNIFMGRWRGFRWSEYLRFNHIKLPDVPDTYDTDYTKEK